MPVKSISLKADDNFPQDADTGVLLTLMCKTSACLPAPVVTWHLMRENVSASFPPGSVVSTPSQLEVVNRVGHVTLTTLLKLSANINLEKTTVSCRSTNDGDNWVFSNKIKLLIKRTLSISTNYILLVVVVQFS